MSQHPPGTTALGYAWSKERWHFFVLIGGLLSPFIIFSQLALLWKLIAGKGTAVWIVDGHLHFYNNYRDFVFSCVPTKDIDHLSTLPAQPFRSSAVVLHMKNGERKYIPALLLTDAAAILMPRLSAALSL